MSQTVPPRFLFRFAFPAPFLADFPPKSMSAELPAECRLPELNDLDGAAEFAKWSCGWNHDGLAVSVSVSGKQQPLKCDAASPKSSDGVQLWIDTRCTQNVHRATRFCHHFVILPRGQGKKQSEPLVTQIPLANAREEAPTRSTDAAITLASEITSDGYKLCAWFPAGALQGFDPESHPRLGFYAVVRDAELGEQFLSVGREFPIDFDPSLWQTLELISAG